MITPHRFGPYLRDDRVMRQTLASYTMARLNTIYDTPTCSPVDDGSRCSLGYTCRPLPLCSPPDSHPRATYDVCGPVPARAPRPRLSPGARTYTGVSGTHPGPLFLRPTQALCFWDLPRPSVSGTHPGDASARDPQGKLVTDPRAAVKQIRLYESSTICLNRVTDTRAAAKRPAALSGESAAAAPRDLARTRAALTSEAH